MMKRIIGYLFLLLAILLSLAFLSQLSKLLSALFNLMSIFSGYYDAYKIGYSIGSLIINCSIFTLIVLLWKKGYQLIKKTKPDNF